MGQVCYLWLVSSMKFSYSFCQSQKYTIDSLNITESDLVKFKKSKITYV